MSNKLNTTRLLTKLVEDIAYSTPQMVELFHKQKQMKTELEQIELSITNINKGVSELVEIGTDFVTEKHIEVARIHDIYKSFVRDIFLGDDVSPTVETIVETINKHKVAYDNSKVIKKEN